MTQAEQSLKRIESGEYVPDAGVRGMTFQDGSRIAARKRVDDVMVWSALSGGDEETETLLARIFVKAKGA